jgi:phospholipid/cholesterol/gamma-HCH transport system substrate-binding protein
MALALKDNLVEALIGAGVLAVGAWFVVFAYTHTQGVTQAGVEYAARFPSTAGITVGSDVRISGIKVGSVTAQEIDPKTFQAKLKFTVAESIQLPLDTVAKISQEGLLGGNFVQLQPGGEIDVLKPGEEVENTVGSVDLMSLVGQALYSGGSPKDKPAEPAPSASSEMP